MKKASEIIAKLGDLTMSAMNDQTLKVLRKDWKASRAALVAALAPERAPQERANATSLLFQAGDEAFAKGLIDLLADDTEDTIRLELLKSISWSIMLNKSLAEILRTESIRIALEHSVDHSGDNLLDQALFVLRDIDAPNLGPFLEGQFAAASGDRRVKIALILANDTEHAAAWKTILAEADGRPPQDWHFRVRNAISSHFASKNSDLTREAEIFFSRNVESFLDQPDYVVEQSTALAFLENAKSADALPALRKLQDHFSGGRDSVIEGKAIVARARLEEGSTLLDLESKLGDPAVSYCAACALLAQQSGPPNDALLNKLIEAARNCYGSYFEDFMVLIRDCGHPEGHDRVRAVLEEKAPGLVLRILGKSEGWSAERLGTLVAKCGLLETTPSSDDLKAAEELCEDPGNLDDLAAAILHLGGCLLELDLEADEVPPNYPELIEKLAEISGRQFSPEDIESEALPSDDGACRISFRSGGRLCQFETEGMGDWIDEGAVLKALNDAAKSVGTAGRYCAFEPRGQHLHVVFAKPEAVEEFSQKTGIALTKRAGKSIQDDSIEKGERVEGFWSRLRKRFR
jgi:hypothetical protein